MWFSKSSSGCRCWFLVEVAGELRAGLVASDFTSTVINPDDTATSSPTVFESTQKPGLYFMDITSAFLTTHGVGHYMIVVEVNTVDGASGPPEVVATLGNFLLVSEEDFDSLATPADVAALSGDGLTSNQAAMLLEMYQLLGLDPTLPLVVSSTSRRVPANGTEIDQLISESDGVVTVQRV